MQEEEIQVDPIMSVETNTNDVSDGSNDSSVQMFQVNDYTEKSFVVTGEQTKTYRTQLKDLGGRFNPKLKCGPGWIFSKKSQESVMEFLLSVENGDHSGSKIPTLNSNGLPCVAVPNTNTKYRWVKYKVYQPQEGMTVTLKTRTGSSKGKVIKTEASHGDNVTDTAYVEFDGETSLAVTCRRKWQIYGYFEEHALFFQ